MVSVKSVLGIIGALVGIAYCGGLVYYFLDLSGSMQQAETDGLRPTILGLGGVGALFCVALIVRVILLLLKLRPPGSSGRGGPDAPKGKGGFDAEAAFERYMAQRPAEATTGAPSAPPAPPGGGPAQRSGFGRKI